MLDRIMFWVAMVWIAAAIWAHGLYWSTIFPLIINP